MGNSAPLPAFGALAGLKVIDLSRVLGGPYCGQILADHGAQVIKVEPPAGDETRAWGPPFADDGTAAYYNGLNRNKRDIVIDLSKPEGREIVLKLLADADVLIENFKIGTLERWGIGYEQTLRERFPRLIHCRVSGFGADGPLGGAPGYDAVAQALGGLMSVNGTPTRSAPGAASSSRPRCTTPPCRCCTRKAPTGCSRARRRSSAAMRIPTSCPTTSS
jgi:formyl-CoA transferase